jgi:hypothetical protein
MCLMGFCCIMWAQQARKEDCAEARSRLGLTGRAAQNVLAPDTAALRTQVERSSKQTAMLRPLIILVL